MVLAFPVDFAGRALVVTCPLTFRGVGDDRIRTYVLAVPTKEALLRSVELSLQALPVIVIPATCSDQLSYVSKVPQKDSIVVRLPHRRGIQIAVTRGVASPSSLLRHKVVLISGQI